MTTATKPGRLTDNKWWFCEINEHEKCATEIELTSRFEGCPCECHQTAPPQPAPDTGEWRVEYDPNAGAMAYVLAGTPYGTSVIASTEGVRHAVQIVSDHNAVPRLIAALEELLRSGVEHDDCRVSYLTMQVDRDAIADARAVLASVHDTERREVK